MGAGAVNDMRARALAGGSVNGDNYFRRQRQLSSRPNSSTFFFAASTLHGKLRVLAAKKNVASRGVSVEPVIVAGPKIIVAIQVGDFIGKLPY